jgi:hypothetical protein
VNCSSSDKNDAATSTGGSGSAGGAGSQAGNTVFSLIAKSWGQFFVKITPTDATLGTVAGTDISGVVKDKANLLSYTETAVSTSNGCTLYKLLAPSCANANSGADCDVSTEVCTATDTCTKMPTKKNVGTVTVSGVQTAAGTSPFALTTSSNSYLTGGDVSIVYPGFTEGAPIKIAASGGDYPAFDITAKGIAQLVLGASSYKVKAASDLNVTWTPPGSASDARIQATLNLSHHGGSKGYIACDVADTGSLTISKDQISGLINMGVAGYPTLVVIRRSTGTAAVGTGQVVLSVESTITPAFAVDGYTSCLLADNSECPTGQTCNQTVKLCE